MDLAYHCLLTAMVSRNPFAVKQETEKETSKREESDRTNGANLNRPVDSQPTHKASCQGRSKTGQEREIIVRALARTKRPKHCGDRRPEPMPRLPRIPLLAFRAASANHRSVAACSRANAETSRVRHSQGFDFAKEVVILAPRWSAMSRGVVGCVDWLGWVGESWNSPDSG